MSNIAKLGNMIKHAMDASKEHQSAQRGIIQGDCVLIDNKLYPYTAVVDLSVSDNNQVWCIVTADKNAAVIVGA